MTQRRIAMNGFTVVELAVVIAVIGILATLIVVFYDDYRRQSVETALQSDLMNAQAQLEADMTFGNTYPASAAAADGGRGLRASKGNSFDYNYNGANNSYCLAVANPDFGAREFHITNTDTTAQVGDC